MPRVTGEQVRAATLAAGITRIPHHDCSICGTWVCYLVHGGNLFFDAGCGCSDFDGEPTPRTWESAAEWINMQSQEQHAVRIAAKFGLVLEAVQNA